MKKSIIKLICAAMAALMLIGSVSCFIIRKDPNWEEPRSTPINVNNPTAGPDASASPFSTASVDPTGTLPPESGLPTDHPQETATADPVDPTSAADTALPTGEQTAPATDSYASPDQTAVQIITAAPTGVPTATQRPTAAPTPTPKPTPTPTPKPTPTPTPKPTPTPTPKPTPTQVPMPIGHPYPTDPTEIGYAEAGKRLMRALQETPGYESLDISARRGYDYLIVINKAQYKNTVTVFCVDEEGNYTRPYLSMVCSAGNDTPLGVFNTKNKYSWHTLMGPCYGQYCTRIVGGVLFHSVPYTTMHKYDLKYNYYNKLGRLASAGCIRLPCNDAKWIYDNCPIGTTVVIYDDSSSAGPLGQPTPMRLDSNDIYLRGWDPTDPDSANPWGDTYKAGYTIRSQIAQADYEYAMAHGLWDGTINRPEQPTPTPEISQEPAPTDTPEPTSAPTDTLEPTSAPTDTPEPASAPTDTPDPNPPEKPTPTVWPWPTPTEEP